MEPVYPVFGIQVNRPVYTREVVSERGSTTNDPRRKRAHILRHRIFDGQSHEVVCMSQCDGEQENRCYFTQETHTNQFQTSYFFGLRSSYSPSDLYPSFSIASMSSLRMACAAIQRKATTE